MRSHATVIGPSVSVLPTRVAIPEEVVTVAARPVSWETMSPEPRSMPAPDPVTGNGNGRSNGSGASGREHGTDGTSSVLVASGAESALAAVERHLRQEAIEARLVATGPATVPRPRTAPAGRATAPVRIAPVPLDEPWDTGEHADPDAEFWGETRTRPRRPAVDLDELPDDERRSVGRLQARKVRRILRHVSPWSVFKFSLLFYLCVWLIILIAGVILWRVGQEAGAIANVETFYAKATGEVTFELDGRSVFRAAASAGVILVMAGTAFTVMLSVLFNLITDLTGGVRMTVVELGDARRPVNTKRAGGRKLLRRVRPASPTTPAEELAPAAASPSSASVPSTR